MTKECWLEVYSYPWAATPLAEIQKQQQKARDELAKGVSDYVRKSYKAIWVKR